MRIGIVSDVHNNARGLRAALARMGDVDELLCAGDVVEEFRFGNEAVELLAERGARCVLGNHDQGLLGPNGIRAREAPGVRADLLRYLSSQPTGLETTVDGKKLVMAHASPLAKGYPYVQRGSRALRALADVDADFVIIGHTHAQLLQRFGRTVVINPGSVGQACDPANGRRLSFAVLDTVSGEASIEDYDEAEAAD